jgi:GTP pyrophosphokinase
MDLAASVWPIATVVTQRRVAIIDDLKSRFGALPAGCWSEGPHTAIALPLTAPDQTQPYGVLVAGVSPHRLLDDGYRAFFELVAAQVATAIRNARAHEDERQRLVDVEWGRTGQLYPVAVHIEAWDRVGLLRDISTIVAEEKVNMVAVRTQERTDRTTTISLTLETEGVDQLSRLLSKLEGVRGVVGVTRSMDQAREQARRAT